MIKRKDERVIENRQNMRDGSGTVSIRHYLRKEDIKASCRLCAELIIPPEAGIGRHEHVNEDEIFMIVSGNGVVNDGEKDVHVGPGDVTITGNGQAHSIRNIGESDLVVIAVIMPYK